MVGEGGRGVLDSLRKKPQEETIGCEKLDPHLESRVRARATLSATFCLRITSPYLRDRMPPPSASAGPALVPVHSMPPVLKWLEFFHLERLKYNSNAAVHGSFKCPLGSIVESIAPKHELGDGRVGLQGNDQVFGARGS